MRLEIWRISILMLLTLHKLPGRIAPKQIYGEAESKQGGEHWFYSKMKG